MKLFRPDDDDSIESDCQSTGFEPSLANWINEFPIESVRKRKWRYLDAEGEVIRSPCHLAVREQLVAEARRKHVLKRDALADLFLPAIGQATDRSATGIGGLPYRPSTTPWPRSSDGEPMLFVAQFRFTESSDIAGDIPGDVMLVFMDDNDFCNLHVEWYPLGIKSLVSRDNALNCMSSSWHGIRYRLDDYIKSAAMFSQYRNPILVASPCGTRIGGTPCSHHEILPGRYLCSLASVKANPEVRYPWPNRARPMSVIECLHPDNHLSLFDMKSFYFYIDDHFQVRHSLADD